MTNFEDRFKNALAMWLQDRHKVDAHAVLEWMQYEDGWSCGNDTCWNDEIRIDITYRNSAGGVQAFGYSGDLGQLMRELP